MDAIQLTDARMLDVALLIARLVVGLMMAAHSTQKLFGWLGGHGLSGTGEYLGELGFYPGRFFATLAGLGELASGLLVALGLFGPIGPAIMLATMIVAAISVHWRHGLFAMTNGIELPLLYATAAIAFALSGYGRYSLDAMLGVTAVWTPALIWTALAIGVIVGILNLVMRRRPGAPAA